MLFILVAKSSKSTSSNDGRSRSSLKNILVVGRAWRTLLLDDLAVDVGLTNNAVAPLLLAARPTDAIHAIVPFIVLAWRRDIIKLGLSSSVQ
jgi:hypothetical protein